MRTAFVYLGLVAACGVARREGQTAARGDGGGTEVRGHCEPVEIQEAAYGFHGVSDGPYIYYAATETGYEGDLRRIRRDTLEVELLVELAAHSPSQSQLAVDEDTLYWAYGIDLRGEIGLLDKAGGELVLVADEETVPRSPSVSGDALYWGGPGRIRRYDLQEQTLNDAFVAETGDRIAWVFADAGDLYYRLLGQVFAVDLTQPEPRAAAVAEAGTPFAVKENALWLYLFASAAGSGPNQIRRVSLSGGTSEVIAEHSSLSAPALGDDGTLVWLSSGEEGGRLNVRRGGVLEEYSAEIPGTPHWLYVGANELWWLSEAGADRGAPMFRLRMDEDCS